MQESRSPAEPGPVTDDRQFAADPAGESPDTHSLVATRYREEIRRTVRWRTRLDRSTNWAVVLMAATLTISFSSAENPHFVLLIGILGVLAFLVIESQRYQEYDHWRYRLRLLQGQVFADVADRDGEAPADWREALGENRRVPTVERSRWRAIGQRLKRVYLLLQTVLIASWGLRITVFEPDGTWTETASIGTASGSLVVAVLVGCYLVLAAVALRSTVVNRMREFHGDPDSRTD